jgi:uracil-DNA glycosylase family 4
LLDQAFKTLGIERSELYITNVAKEWPRTPEGATRRPTPEEILFWRPVLDSELEACSPAAILLLGKTASESWGYTDDLIEQGIFSAWHPAYLLHSRRSPDLWSKWLFQISPFVRKVRAAEALRA